MIERRKEAKSSESCSRSKCPVSCVLDLLGDKWTLLLVRDLLLGKGTYTEFQQSPEGIPTNILAERLKRLQAAGIIERLPYQQRPVRYRYKLTNKGSDLYPVLSAMIDWGNCYVEGTISRAEIEAMVAGKSTGTE
jgi:DNA-binding HxlR family transcriptional regulator